MSDKRKRAARVVQNRLGISYCQALDRLRTLENQGLPLDEAVATTIDQAHKAKP